jgi:hypothetical protein
MERLNPRRRHHRPALRDTFDQLYDGACTRRCRLGPAVQDREDHFGTLAEINLQR